MSIDDVDIIETEKQFIVKVKGHDQSGRADVEVGVVNKTDMRGDTANAQMKAVTKGKRRLTLSLCGLGWLDETEVQTIPDARPVAVAETGEIIDAPTDPETISQETGEAVPPVQMYGYLSGEVVAAVTAVTKYSKPDVCSHLSEAYRSSKIGKTLTIAEAEDFARKLIEPK